LDKKERSMMRRRRTICGLVVAGLGLLLALSPAAGFAVIDLKEADKASTAEVNRLELTA